MLGRLRLRGQPAPKVGDGGGESVTEDTALLQTSLGLTLDAPGIDDTKLRFTDDEAGRRVAVGVAASGAKKVKFLVFESLANDAMQLRGTLERFVRAFGAKAVRACVVVASKADLRRDPAARKRRLALIRQVMQQQGLKELVLWQNQGIKKAANTAQLAALQESLGRTEGVALAALEDLHQRQRARAQQLCDAHPTQTRNTTVAVEEQYTVPRQVQEPFQEPYVEQEEFDEQYEAPETYEVPEQLPYTYRKRRGGLAGVVGKKKTCTDYITIMVQKVRMVTRTRRATREVTRYRTAYRTVTHYDTATRTVQKPTTVEYRLPLEHFTDQALQQIVKEVRATLAA